MGQVVVHPAADLRAPEKLRPSHSLSAFVSQEPLLDDWLKNAALRNEGRSSRTFVICVQGTGEVIGFYSLASGIVQRIVAIKSLQRNAPDPIPVMILGRLAVAQSWQGQGLGGALLRDAVLRALGVSEQAGMAALLVHAKNDGAVAFYKKNSFIPSALEPMTLMLPLSAVRAAVGPAIGVVS